MSEHWYTKNGEPRYDADKREARKYGYYPSVTTIIKNVRNYGLDKWIKENGYLSAEAVKRLDKESDEDWFARVDVKASEISTEASTKGSFFHDTVEKHLSIMRENASVDVHFEWPEEIRSWQPYFQEYANQYLSAIIDVEKVLVSHDMGIAGKTDLIAIDKECGFVVMDWKTQGIKSRPAFYDTWSWQLGAYGKCIEDISGDMGRPMGISIIIPSQKPGPFIRKVWREEDMNRGLRIVEILAELWRLTEKFDPRDSIE